MARSIESVMALIMAAAENACQIIGEKTIEYGQELLSVPVEKGEGGKVIRSLPGEPPRREFGDLQAGLQFTVDREASSRVELQIESGDAEKPSVPAILELGEFNIAQRPYFASDGGDKPPMIDFTKDIAASILKAQLDTVK